MYPGTPPPAVTVAVPSQIPLQEASIEVMEEVNGGGSVIVTVCCVVHPFASVIETVYVLGQRFATEAVP